MLDFVECKLSVHNVLVECKLSIQYVLCLV